MPGHPLTTPARRLATHDTLLEGLTGTHSSFGAGHPRLPQHILRVDRPATEAVELGGLHNAYGSIGPPKQNRKVVIRHAEQARINKQFPPLDLYQQRNKPALRDLPPRDPIVDRRVLDAGPCRNVSSPPERRHEPSYGCDLRHTP